MNRILAALVFSALAPIAQAQIQVYRCHVNGHTVYTDQACPGHGSRINLENPTTASVSQGVGSGVSALPQDLQENPKRKQKEKPGRTNTAEQRVIPGVSCPTQRVIEDAINDHEVKLCMTPQEVNKAKPVLAVDPVVKHRKLPNGHVVVDWIFSQDMLNWPTVIRFRYNRVIRFSNQLPSYYHK